MFSIATLRPYLFLHISIVLILASCATPPEQPAPEAKGVLLEELITRDMTREQFKDRILREFRLHDLDKDGLDAHDLDIAATTVQNNMRAITVAGILRNDLDGDGRVTRKEIEISVRRQHRLPDEGPLEPAIAKAVARHVEKSMEADRDGDSVISFDEMRAYQPSWGARGPNFDVEILRQLLALDPNQDGRLTIDEATNLANDTFDQYDTDRDGTIRGAEFAAVEHVVATRRVQQEARDRCHLPKPRPEDQVAVFGTTQGSGVPTVSVAGLDEETTLGKVVIEPGNVPLYIVLSSSHPMIWRFEGATDRASRAMVIPSRSGEGSGAGVVGLRAEQVGFLDPGSCLANFYEVRSKWAQKVRAVIEHAIQRRIDVFAADNRLMSVDLPSGRLTESVPRPGPAPEGTDARIWRDLAPFYPGGISDLDPATVVSPKPAQIYEVLPKRAGLLMLILDGSIVRTRDGAFRIIKPIPRFPPGFKDSTPVRYLLGKGIPMPGGIPGRVCIFSEETGEPLNDYTRSPICRRR